MSVVTPPIPVATSTTAPAAPAEGEFKFSKAPETKTETPATGAPVVEAKTEAKTETPTVVDKGAAIKAAARASKEARDARKALETAQAELTKLKGDGTNTSAAQAELDAIKKNPSLLLKNGWDHDKILKHLLMPEEAAKETDPEVKRLADEVKAIKDENNKKTKAEGERADAELRAQIAADTVTAHANVAKMIEAMPETFLIDAEDAPEITNAIVQYCIDEKIEHLSLDEQKDLVAQWAKHHHELRNKRFGKKVSSPSPQAKTDTTDSPGFRDSKQQQSSQAKPAPATSITSSQDPLPTATVKYTPGFR